MIHSYVILKKVERVVDNAMRHEVARKGAHDHSDIRVRYIIDEYSFKLLEQVLAELRAERGPV